MEIVLPSSPVWYQTKASDTSSDGYFAFASRNLVYVLDIQGDIPRHYGILSGHEERVTTCCFCCKKPSSEVLYLASGGDDSTVKVWNVFTKTVAYENRTNGIGKISAVHWSPISEHLIAFGDDKGCLVVWDLDKGAYNKYFPDGGHQQISCVVFSPYYSHLVAVGYKSGAVSIIDINNKGMVYRKLRGHGNEVQSIVWSFYPRENIFSVSKSDQENDEATGQPSQQTEKAILATGSKDKTIRLWSLSKGKTVKTLKIPSKPSKGRRVSDDVTRLYVTLHWPSDSESRFVASSYNGDILLWDLKKGDKGTYQVLSGNSPDSGHQRIVFNINSGLAPGTLVSTSMDRHIKLWSLNSPQSPPVCSLPTLGGFVYSIAISPVNPSLVAVGVGDGVIRVWKTKNPRNPFDINILWQGVKEKVMSMAWHPSNDGLLAFGTEDGKVGLYDVMSMRAPVLSESYHLKPVYAMSWGPRCSVEKGGSSDLCLFTCGGEGVIFMHPPSLEGDVMDIATVIATTNPGHHPGRRSEVMWRPDHDMVALGNDNGSFSVYLAPDLRHVITVKVHNKLINCLRWCPVPSDHEFHNMIASGSNTSQVCVTNLTESLQSIDGSVSPLNGEDEIPSTRVHTEAYRTLCGHNGKITDLAWNVNQPSQLVSASYDGTLQVWDVSRGEGVANYRGHNGRVLCVGWSPLPDKDAESGSIFSGADDYSVHVWQSEKQENKMPPKGNNPSTTSGTFTLSVSVTGPASVVQSLFKYAKPPGLSFTRKLSQCEDNDSHNQFHQPYSTDGPDMVDHLQQMLVGYTQKQTSQWKRKSKKKPKEGSCAPPAASISNHGDGCLDIDQLLERKKLELLKDIDLHDRVLDAGSDRRLAECINARAGQDNSAPNSIELLQHGRLNPNARPWKAAALSSDEILMELSAARNVAIETKDDDGVVSSHSNRRKRFKNLFPLSVALDNQNKEQQQEDCIDIVRWNNDQLSRHIPHRPNMGLYGDRRSVYRMLHKEDEKLLEMGNYDGSYALKLWRADVIGAIESAMERNDLTDQLVAMAPMAGYDVWLRACASFADQLSREGLHLHAANYLLACNKVTEAITLLRDNKHYREAVAMARARLPDNHELLMATVKTWAHRLKNGGSLEMAAKCFASIKEYKMAAECLAERASTKTSQLNKDDIRSLFCATTLAKSAELEDSHQFAKRALLDITTRSGRWKDGQMAASSFNSRLAEIRLLLCLHELLCLCLSTNNPGFSLDDTFTDHACNAWPESADVKGRNFGKHVLLVWSLRILDGFSLSSDFYANLLRHVEPYLMTSSTADLTVKQSIYRISLHLTCALLHTCVTDTSTMTSDLQGSRQHVTSCRAISDLGESIRYSLQEIYESVDSLSHGKTIRSSDNRSTSSTNVCDVDDVTNSFSEFLSSSNDVTKSCLLSENTAVTQLLRNDDVI